MFYKMVLQVNQVLTYNFLIDFKRPAILFFNSTSAHELLSHDRVYTGSFMFMKKQGQDSDIQSQSQG